jgi:phosphate:Na+ symporter
VRRTAWGTLFLGIVLENAWMIRDMILGLIGGLGLFLFGMALLSDGLKKVAGRKLRIVLETMTKNTYVGFIVGFVMTTLVQSSSGATVIVIGLVNAGLLTLKQAIGVIIGTNVGTTTTAWIVSVAAIGFLKIDLYVLPAIGLGFALQAGGRTKTMKNVGAVLLGLGLLFLGLEYMKDAFASVRTSTQVQEIFVTYGGNPLFGVLAGMILTPLVQSSSAAIAIVQLLAVGGAFGTNWQMVLDMAIPFVLGANIGTTVTAQLASLQSSRTTRRAAWAHTTFNLLGTAIALPFVYLGLYGNLVDLLTPWELSQGTIAVSIAVAHTTFNVINSLIFLPLTSALEKLAFWLVPLHPSEAAAQPVILERHLLGTPEIALDQARREIVRMAKTAKAGFADAVSGLITDDRKKLESARAAEDFTDTQQYEITSYLTELSRQQLSDDVAIGLPVLLHTVNDLERIGDHAVNIAEIAARKIDQKLSFSDQALAEMNQLDTEANAMFDLVIAALDQNDPTMARSALLNEDNLNRMQIDYRRSHVQRMTEGNCAAEAGLIFIDLVDNVEKIGDHLTNIAQAVIGGLHWDGVELKMIAPE